MTKGTAGIALILSMSVLIGFHMLNVQVFQARMTEDLSDFAKQADAAGIPVAQRDAIQALALSSTQNIQSLNDQNFMILLIGGMIIAARVLMPRKIQ